MGAHRTTQMGGSSSVYKGETKEVLVIGGGMAGCAVVKELAKTESSITITLVSDKEYLDFNFGSPRGLTDPNSAAERCFPLKEVCDFYSKDIKFVVGEVEVVAKDHAMLKDGQKISFDAAVLCTGAHYGNNPWKAMIGERTWQQRVETMGEWKAKVEAAENIVVAGAGIVGVEVAAELGHAYAQHNKKNVTLVGSFMKQVPSLEGRSRSVLTDLKVKMIPGRTGEWNDGDKTVKIGDEEIACDLLLRCTGLNFSSGMMQQHYSEKIDHSRVKCNDSLLVADSLFACGDIVAIPAGRSPAAAPAQTCDDMAPIVVANLLDQLGGKPMTSTFEFPKEPTERPCLISLGPEQGGGVLPCFMCCYGCCGGCGCGWCGNCMAAKFKSGDGFVGLQKGNYGFGKTWSDAYYTTTPGQVQTASK